MADTGLECVGFWAGCLAKAVMVYQADWEIEALAGRLLFYRHVVAKDCDRHCKAAEGHSRAD